ncbi:acetoacetate decarboxylase family protein [Streptomyces sp. NPDC001185]|uniref:acetoacetate decarboxylase family protein n=1 Tax=unclassified Streptomyces TaxID=2593676 RepID=UPI00332071BE
MTGYPKEPWRLAGQMYLSLWLVTRHALPQVPLGTRPVTVAGRGVVGAAWVVYENDSVLSYNELLRAVLVRAGTRPRVCITDIWVDSEISKAGGRELWGIPKEMATFRLDRADGLRASASSGDGLVAGAAFRPGRGLPGRWPLSYRVAQTLSGRLKTSPVRSRTDLSLARADWTVADSGPLRALGLSRPVISLELSDFRLRFGDTTTGPPTGGE